MLHPKSPQNSFYGSYLYDSIVPQDHLLRKINEVVDFSFIKDLVKDRYREDFGRPTEDPVYMFKLILLGYIYGHSDKQVVEHAGVNMAYKYFLGLNIDDEVADDTTISFFRVKRLGEEKFQEIFDQIVQQCVDKGLVKGKSQMIDSTPIVANAAVTSLTGLIKKCRSNVLEDIQKQNRKSAKRLGYEESHISKQDRFTPKEEALEKEIEEAKKLLSGVTREFRKKRLKVNDKLIQNINLLEKAVADREEGTKDRLVSTSDPDARAGRKDSKKWTGYKGHVMVEEESEIITAVETTPANKDDGSQLKPLLNQQEKVHDIRPEQLSADRAYGSGANLETLDDKQITGYISVVERTNPTGTDLFKREDFVYDPVHNTLTCPAGCVAKCRGREMVFREKQQRKGFIFTFSSKQCGTCELKPLCVTSVSKYLGRSVRVNHYEHFYQQMKQRMDSKEGKEAYRNPYKIEHKVADLARYCGMRRSRYRGLARTKIHTLLAATVSNVKRMAKVLWKSPEETIPKPVLVG